VSGESPSSVVRYGLTSALGSAACRRGPGRRPRRPGRRRSFMSSVMFWLMCTANRPFVVRRALIQWPRAAYGRATSACTHAPSTAHDVSVLWWNGNDRANSHDGSGVTAWRGIRTRYRRRSSQQSDGRVCHADRVGVPLTRASRGPHNQQVADRCTSIAPSRDSRKQLLRHPVPRIPSSVRPTCPASLTSRPLAFAT
jgi:hypothetical protein